MKPIAYLKVATVLMISTMLATATTIVNFLQLSFLLEFDTILAHCNKKATQALFSATMGQNVKILAESILRDAIELSMLVVT
jgi:hypothetical protein